MGLATMLYILGISIGAIAIIGFGIVLYCEARKGEY